MLLKRAANLGERPPATPRASAEQGPRVRLVRRANGPGVWLTGRRGGEAPSRVASQARRPLKSGPPPRLDEATVRRTPIRDPLWIVGLDERTESRPPGRNRLLPVLLDPRRPSTD